MMFFTPKGAGFFNDFIPKMINPNIAATLNKLPEKIATSFSGTKFISTYFKIVSIAPEPKKSNIGNNKPAFSISGFDSFTEAKYTAISAITIPIILKKVTDSLYKKTPNNIGITTDILPATEVTDTPFF